MRCGWITCLALLATLSVAYAHSDPELFGADVAEGGSGGRYFTDSRADGFSCAVCHGAREARDVEVFGWPDTFVPGARHEVRLAWPADAAPHALQLEVATADGSHAQVELLDSPGARCPEGGESATYVTDLGARRVVGLRACGASEVAFAFVFPTDGDVTLSVGGVVSDASETVEGDSTFTLREELAPTAASSGCAAGGTGAAPWWLMLG